MKTAEIFFRVRYCETDQMGTYGSARALDWFEHGRTEAMRALGLPYAEMERRGVLMPVVEAHVEYLGRAAYDDPLRMEVRLRMAGRLRVRFEFEVTHAETGRPVCRGWTVNAATNRDGRPARPPAWLAELFGGG